MKKQVTPILQTSSKAHAPPPSTTKSCMARQMRRLRTDGDLGEFWLICANLIDGFRQRSLTKGHSRLMVRTAGVVVDT